MQVTAKKLQMKLIFSRTCFEKDLLEFFPLLMCILLSCISMFGEFLFLRMKLRRDILDEDADVENGVAFWMWCPVGVTQNLNKAVSLKKQASRLLLKKGLYKTFIEITAHQNLSYLLPPGAISVSDAQDQSVISLSHKEHHTLAPGVVMPSLIKVSSHA